MSVCAFVLHRVVGQGQCSSSILRIRPKWSSSRSKLWRRDLQGVWS